jgi:hypothetical protein
MDPELLGERLGDPLRPGQRAGQRPADLEHVLADLFPEEHHVIGRDVLDFGGSEIENLGDVAHAAGGEMALLLLYQVQSGEHGRPLPIRRVLRQQLVQRGAPRRRERERRSFFDQPALALLEALAIVNHQRMKTHRSTSPMTTSVDPITAMTSAIMPPTISFGSPWHA